MALQPPSRGGAVVGLGVVHNGLEAMKEVISRRLVTRQIRYHESLALTYLTNPKAGCTNIKTGLWAQIDRNMGVQTLPAGGSAPHKLSKSPFVQSVFDRNNIDIDKFARSRFFTVVRNPFTRTLSAYLNKIATGNGNSVWKKFCKRYGGHTYSFKEFLRMIAADDIEELDPHFRPQYINVLYPFIPFNFVGKLERMADAHAYMASCGIEPNSVDQDVSSSVSRNRTGANEKIASFYDEECEAIVRELYRDDFIAFGYSDDLNDVQIVAPVPEREEMPNRLLEFVMGQEGQVTDQERRLGEIRARLAELGGEREALQAERDQLRAALGIGAIPRATAG